MVQPIKILMCLGLLCWATLFWGWKRGWVTRKDIIEYAVSLLVESKNEADENVALIASGESLDDRELLDLVSKQAKNADQETAMDKWRLAHLISLAESGATDQEKLDKLQELYAEFEYPEDMASCSIYAQDDVDPLVVMTEVVNMLKRRFSCQ